VILVVWVALQVLVVLAQDRYGPQFFVPARFLPQKYNYYRPVPMSSRGDNSNVNSSSSGSAVMDNDIESGTGPECAICYNTVDPSLQDHMITPCDHRCVASHNITASLSV
jgi:transmembrane E3 ubiquitin-protein ligase